VIFIRFRALIGGVLLLVSVLATFLLMSDNQDQYLKLMRENRDRIYRIAAFYCDDPQDVNDLSQEIAYQVWKSFDSFRSESQMSTWLHRIALNTAIHYLKRSKKRIKTTYNETYNPESHQGDQHESNDARINRLMRAIQHLREIDKAIILLYLEEKSHAEIAEIVNMSISNVGTRIQRIKKQLKIRLTGQNHGH